MSRPSACSILAPPTMKLRDIFKHAQQMPAKTTGKPVTLSDTVSISSWCAFKRRWSTHEACTNAMTKNASNATTSAPSEPVGIDVAARRNSPERFAPATTPTKSGMNMMKRPKNEYLDVPPSSFGGALA